MGCIQRGMVVGKFETGLFISPTLLSSLHYHYIYYTITAPVHQYHQPPLLPTLSTTLARPFYQHTSQTLHTQTLTCHTLAYHHCNNATSYHHWTISNSTYYSNYSSMLPSRGKKILKQKSNLNFCFGTCTSFF